MTAILRRPSVTRSTLKAWRGRDDWKLEGACVAAVAEGRITPEDFFAESGTKGYVARTRTARWLCRDCPVQRRCLEDAMATRDFYGVRGGLTGSAREKLQRERNRQTPAIA